MNRICFTDTETTRICSCGAHIIRPAGPEGSWMATDGERPGDFWHEGGALHQPVCPPSEEIILALPWFEVPLGELVLYAGRFMRLEAMWPATDDSQWLGITVLHGAATTDHQVRAVDITVVKRYVED